MKFFVFNREKPRAQAIVEFAIALPILLLVIYGLIETGRLLFIYSSVNNASRQAVRYGSTTGNNAAGVPRFKDCAGIRASAQQSDFLNAFDDNDIVITYDEGDATLPFYTCAGATDNGVPEIQGMRVTVTITADFNPLVPSILPFIKRTVANGNPITAISSRSLLLTVDVDPLRKDPIVTISFSPEPSQVGDPVAINVKVTGPSPTDPVPTGTVKIQGENVNCTGALSLSGTYGCTAIFTSVGQKTVTFAYGGDKEYLGTKVTSGIHTVNAWPTVVNVSSSPDTTVVNTSTTVTVTVNGVGGTTTPTGMVTVTADDGATCDAVITLASGTGTCTMTFTSTGIKVLNATFVSTNPEYADNTGTSVHWVILPGNTATTIYKHIPDPQDVNKLVTVFMRVTGTSSSPTGSVELRDVDTSSVLCTITLTAETATSSNGSCSITYSTAGTKRLQATYAGDANNAGSTSAITLHAISKISTTTAIASQTSNPSYASPPSGGGDNVLVTVTVTSNTAPPTGSVTVNGDGTTCTIASLTPSGATTSTGSCNVNFTTTGTKQITATFNGDAIYAGSVSTPVSQTVLYRIPSCDASHVYTNAVGDIIAQLVYPANDNKMRFTITNTLTDQIKIKDVKVTWNNTTGATASQPLNLTNALLSTVLWAGSSNGPVPFTITPAVDTYLAGNNTVTTVEFTFDATYKYPGSTDLVVITFSSAGCETLTIKGTPTGN